jgi:hypothetical protein
MQRKPVFCDRSISFAKAAHRGSGDSLTQFEHYGEFGARSRRFSLSLVLSLMIVVPACAQTALAPDPRTPPFEISSRQVLLGDWGGERAALAEKGIKLRLLLHHRFAGPTRVETRGFLKALVETKSNRILGFTAFGVGIGHC